MIYSWTKTRTYLLLQKESNVLLWILPPNSVHRRFPSFDVLFNKTSMKIKAPLSVVINSSFSLDRSWNPGGLRLQQFFCRVSFSCIRHFSTSFTGTNRFNMAAARRSESRKLKKDSEGAQFSSQFIQVVYVVLVISLEGLIAYSIHIALFKSKSLSLIVWLWMILSTA